jgi:hypothetical protein
MGSGFPCQTISGCCAGTGCRRSGLMARCLIAESAIHSFNTFL